MVCYILLLKVPQFILDQHAKEKRRVNILVTQPRKIAASSVARRVCQERGWSLGGLVGYQVSWSLGADSYKVHSIATTQ